MWYVGDLEKAELRVHNYFIFTQECSFLPENYEDKLGIPSLVRTRSQTKVSIAAGVRMFLWVYSYFTCFNFCVGFNFMNFDKASQNENMSIKKFVLIKLPQML